MRSIDIGRSWTTSKRALCFSFALLLGAVPHALAQSDLSGYWDLKVPVGDGTFQETFFELQQNSGTIAGKLLRRDIPIQGTLTGSTIHLATVPPTTGTNNRHITAYDGTYENGKLTLEMHIQHGQLAKGEAERTTKDATMPPAPLPLPTLRDLPDNGLVRTPPMGWNSWNKFAGKITDADVRSMADAMVSSGMSKLGYVYINIDDTWELGRDASGNITTNNKFPDMKALADYVHSKGLKIGIYSSPGPKTCAGYEGSFAHEEKDAKTYAAWGIDYLKYDLCSAGDIYPSSEANQRGLYQKMGDALEHTGRPIVFSLCQYGQNAPWKWGAKVSGNLWRTTGDISDNWKSMDTIGFSQLAIASYTRPGHWNDPDMLEVGNGGMTADEYRTHMSLWSLLSAPLIAGNDLRTMTDETTSILMNQEVIAIDQDPAAKPTQELTKDGSVEILWRTMQDGSIIVGFFNRGDQATDAGVQWSALPGGIAGKKLKARDLWKHEAVPTTGDRFNANVPAHGVVLLRISGR
ncbi:glycoside hydrolase family 27 protein [Granulicella arctica]|uniref:Alpha-galactosidase n=1 Tax=Granulicella arctica TaxID=940613 RepID=A0A7Y9TG10_9BACT|nr:glycoside hydrolase family 27 protein [Granulicella arctica]NYF79376.1 alpha-galactosidase [Granulicella arctica]